jgi:hypothetical protein
MWVTYCKNCGRETGHKRALGWGTFFAVILTFGLWFLIIPFYPLRCIICGQTVGTPPSERLTVHEADSKGSYFAKVEEARKKEEAKKRLQ